MADNDHTIDPKKATPPEKKLQTGSGQTAEPTTLTTQEKDAVKEAQKEQK